MNRVASAIGWHAVMVVLFVGVTVVVRGITIASLGVINPDEAELMAQARAAMLSPVPFTTWTSGTTGPFWVLFLALLGWMGVPLTIVFAHLLSAVLVGLMGYTVFVLLRRSLGLWSGLIVSVLWWLPIALIYPVGGVTNFGALATELLPGLLVLMAALVRTDWLMKRPWLLIVAGVLSGLAIGSKYQILPVVGALLVVQLFSIRLPWRTIVVSVLFWIAGAALPFLLVILAMVLSPQMSVELLQQNLSFLGSYAGGVDLVTRLANTSSLILQWYLLGAAIVLARLFAISAVRIVVLRGFLVFAGLFAVFAGGMAFGHYLIVLYVALALATSLAVKDGTQLVPVGVLRPIAISGFAVFVVGLVIVGYVSGRVAFVGPTFVSAALSPNSVTRDPGWERDCPEGSEVLVWGWASELYVNYSWHNTVPFMNALGILSNPAIHDASELAVDSAIKRSDCIVDAVGSPFFAFGPEMSLASVYPQFADDLERDFTRIAPGGCEACHIYVRD